MQSWRPFGSLCLVLTAALLCACPGDPDDKEDAASASDAGSSDTAQPDAAGDDGAQPDAEVTDSAAADAGGPDPSIVTTASGAVQGVVEPGFRVFKGIPYAAPPVAELRWKPPQPHAGWSGVRDATDFGPSCSQSPLPRYGESFDEDCLTLSVWTPDPVPASPAPVMVWFHWGYFEYGSSYSIWNNGQYIAELTGTVVVALNYRLGPLGFLTHPSLEPDSGNYGLLDQRAALAWIRDNIAAFGGDPDNVTIFGPDAGAFAVCAHMTSEGSDGLFHRAIMQSGGCPQDPGGFLTKAEAEAQGAELAVAVGCDSAGDVATCLRSKTDAELYSALPAYDIRTQEGARWGPIVDGTILADQPMALVQAGDFSHVPLIIGANSDEASKWFEDYQAMTEGDYTTWVNSVFDAAASDVLAHYPAASFASPATAASQVLGDAMFVCPVRRTARAMSVAGVDTYLYHFTHPPHWTTEFRGAYQWAEVWIVFQTYSEPLGAHTPEELAFSNQVMGYWTRFDDTGDPNDGLALAWPAYASATDRHIVLNPTLETGSGLKQVECDFWDTLLP